ncbi:hypothetical protein F2Q70_00015268 [Brassica cretica]|uniref:3-oxoacyl-[acyl-carrier-protein] reductase n=1 Tax=Brassica cretica TaxID=69181 RepID=A0A8S9HRI2_BRACR|nr:hypothetical protein F2Q70_00015268 [Brassica cretica]
MDSINRIINFVFPPLALYGLFVFYPIYQRLKSAVSIWRNVLPENVAGKVVLITGAASGIGEAPYEYGKKGAYLALVDIRDEPLFHVAALIEHYGSPEVIPMVADVSKLHDCERFIQAAVLQFWPMYVNSPDYILDVDHLVTNAGVAPLYLFEDIDDLSMVMPAMASKAAVIAFYETLRIEFGSKVGVTIVAPGVVDSEMTQGKFMTKNGQFIVDKELRDVHISLLPVESAERCAKAILRSKERVQRR